MGITLRHGVNSLTLDDVDNRTVGEIRNQAEHLLSIPSNAQARVNGEPVPDGHVVCAGSTLEFVKVAGEKGVTKSWYVHIRS